MADRDVGESAGDERQLVPRGGRPLPLNSRRLTGVHLQRLARRLELPTSASADETRLIIDGKLSEMGREPRNVQVMIAEPEVGGAECLWLQDETGVFLQAELDSEPHEPILGDGEERSELEEGHEDQEEELPATLEGLQQALAEATERQHQLTLQLEGQGQELKAVQEALADEKSRVASLAEESEERAVEVSNLKEGVRREKEKVREIWRLNCEQLAQYDAEGMSKDAEIASLKARLRELESDSSEVPRESMDPPPTHATGIESLSARTATVPAHATPPPGPEPVTSRAPRRGKAPPVDAFTGENPEVRFEDWLPTLERAASWNGWSNEERLMQLAGYLRQRALQEWNLLAVEDKATYEAATRVLRTRLDPGNRVLAAQDFRHAVQGDTECVADYIRRLERLFQIAYGHDNLATETRETFLHSQLQEGLRYDLMKSPAVSGCRMYKDLCVSAKHEEKRIAELKRRQQYQRPGAQPSLQRNRDKPPLPQSAKKLPPQSLPGSRPIRRCYNCNATDHLARDCKQPKSESTGRPPRQGGKRTPDASTKMVTSNPSQQLSDDPLDFLYSSESDEGEVLLIRVEDRGSKPRRALVEVQGVPSYGVIDSGADITIMGADLFKKVAAAAHLKKRNFKKPDKVPYTYDQKSFNLDGRIDLDISFDGLSMCTPVYVKMDAQDPLLLSEGVCRQLGIIAYHPSIELPTVQKPKEKPPTKVPTVRVRLIESVRLPPQRCVMASVQLEEGHHFCGTLLVEPTHRFEESESSELQFSSSLVEATEEGSAQVLITNPTGFTQRLDSGVWLGSATEANLVDPGLCEPREELPSEPVEPAYVKAVQGRDDQRKRTLARLLAEEGSNLPWQERSKLHSLLLDHHQAFALEDGERGETDLVEMTINTGDSPPKKQPVRRIPFAVRQEVAHQLRAMQDAGVIRPSSSPWASPIVLVRKKDGSLRFCIDYRALNSVTKADTFPLPRIDDLLDQLGKSKYFSTLDLAAGYWQVRMHSDSQEKTAFVTHQGLYEFQVMPFGLCNAPAVFQRLMQRVIMGLNPEEGPDFVAVYLDDVLIFSETLEDHLQHVRMVIERVMATGLKLKPVKCHFVRHEVEYLGHVVTPDGLKPNLHRVAAVREFATPRNVTETRQFLGLASYYRRFILRFAKIAQPLHQLTKKGAQFDWTAECQTAFDRLKSELTEAPVLAYPDFNKDFTLETDASVRGLGAVLSQTQSDGRSHPIAYASRALSPPEKNYGITELETLAVVWAISHFHAYLYGHKVTVLTDHSAVKAVLGTPSPSGKHARWWTKVFGSGVKEVDIVYRSGKENLNADALSRRPHLLAPSEGIAEADVQVAMIDSTAVCDLEKYSIRDLLHTGPQSEVASTSNSLAVEQRRDPEVSQMISYLENGELPSDDKQARKIAAQAPLFVIVDDILYYLHPKRDDRKCVVVPQLLRPSIMEENHSGPMAGHFSGARLYNALIRRWWWPGMYKDALNHCKSCPQCAVVSGTGRIHRPPLRPIPVQRVFQILGVDVMELPKTDRGNKYVVVFQDFLSKWPLVFPIPDQKSIRIARLLVEEVIPLFGVPEALLSDRGTNLLSHLMRDVCDMLGVKKLNTTAYHPQSDGMVERFNRTLKAMLRKHAAKFGAQWDRYLPGVLWAYRNTPHESTGEKPSFLLFGFDCRSPTEAALLPPTEAQQTDLSDYRQELVLSLSSAREMATKSIRKAQRRYKTQYDKRSSTIDYKVGDWVLVRFPQDETGAQRKLSRPWHGPYRIVSRDDPDLTVSKVYFPDEAHIQIHQMRVQQCPPDFPGGYYWYGSRRSSPGRPPKWVEHLLSTTNPSQEQSRPDATDNEVDADVDTFEKMTPNGSDTSESLQSSRRPEIGQEVGQRRTRTRIIVPPARLMTLGSSSKWPGGDVTE